MRRATLFTGATTLALLLAAGPAWSITFGPDAFGYAGADDDETSVSYSWVDMSGGVEATFIPGGGPPTSIDDSQTAAIDLDFTFTYYGTDYTSVYIQTNGTVTFAPLLATAAAPFHGVQCPLPQPDEVDGMIAFYQRDFDPASTPCGTGCTIYYDSGGTTPNMWWGVTFTAVPIFISPTDPSPPPPDPVSVQLILNEDNSIKVQVLEAGVNVGDDCMIGVEAPAGVAGLSMPGCLSTDYTRDNQAVVFTAPTGGTPVVPLGRVGWDRPSNTVTHDFTAFNLESTDVVFAVTAAGGTWTTTPSVTTLTVTAGSSTSFSVDVDIPATAVGGDADPSIITLSPTSGGVGDKTVDVTTLVQDDPDSWQRFSFMPITVDQPASAVVGDDIWLFSGYTYDALSVTRIIQNTIQVLHTDSRSWNHSDVALGGTLTPLDWGGGNANACTVGGLVYVTGGLTGDTDAPVSAATRIYDPATDSWSAGADMPEPRQLHAQVCSSDTVYVIGGYGDYDTDGFAHPQESFWAYSPTGDSWSESLAQHPGPRARHTAEMIDSNTILVAGGYFDNYLSKTTHTYSISGDAWEETVGNLPWERLAMGSGVLPTGRMCLVGGSSFADWPTTLLEDTYDCYSDGYWIPQIANMNPPARTYVVAETVNDTIYAIGGVETDTLGWPPTQYDQTGLIDRYPSSTMPDAPVDAPADVPSDGDDVPGDIPSIDVPTDTESDTSTDTSIDIPTDDGGSEDSGCGCSIVS
ncbi:MAG: hypothetical protein JRG91_05120 [Deltaproteobacteria bacterium]|nr:hypothetical protein [Deltaproteobacteria bacterium]